MAYTLSIFVVFLAMASFVLSQEITYKIAGNMSARSECQLMAVDPELPDRITAIMEESVKMLRLKVEILGDNGVLNKSVVGNMSHPFTWVFIFGSAGRSLLMLKESFNPMSLFTLGFGVTEEKVILDQHPPNCLQQIYEAEAELILRELLVRNFGTNQTGMSPSFPEGTQLCNMFIVENQKDGIAMFQYKCCGEDDLGGTTCHLLYRDSWMSVLLFIITVVKVGFMLYSPLYMPPFLYRVQSIYTSYKVNMPQNHTMTVALKKETPKLGYQQAKLESTNSMEKFVSTLAVMKQCKTYRLDLKVVDIGVKANTILPENFAPVGPFAFMDHFILKCKMRHDVTSLTACCNADVLKARTCCKSFERQRASVQWYRILTSLMTFLAVVLMISPWVGRILFYYKYEESGINRRRNAALTKDLQTEQSDSLTHTLSPEHPVFIFIYAAIPIEVLAFIVLPKGIKSKIKFTLRRCFRDMLDTDRLAAVSQFIADCLWPLKKCGIVGLVVMPFWLCFAIPFRVLILLFEILPVINLSVRLIVNFFYYLVKTINPGTTTKSCPAATQTVFKRMRGFISTVLVIDKRERNFRSNKVLHAVGQLMSLILMIIILTAVFECVTFFLECVIYLIIGIILNPSDTIKYASFVILIVFYASDCFSGVRKRYLAFNKSINSNIKSFLGDSLIDVALQSESEQGNTAFMANASDPEEHQNIQLRRGRKGHIKWRAPRLMMFLDTKDTACISKAFFFRACKFPYFCCPGPLHLSYLLAVSEFLMIIVFLAFVLLVILAFGHAHNVSSANQTFATLVGGFLPLMFRKILFVAHAAPSIDTGDIKWTATFRNEVDRYSEAWVVQDFEATIIQEDSEADHVTSDPDLIVVKDDSGENPKFFMPINKDDDLKAVVYTL